VTEPEEPASIVDIVRPVIERCRSLAELVAELLLPS